MAIDHADPTECADTARPRTLTAVRPRRPLSFAFSAFGADSPRDAQDRPLPPAKEPGRGATTLTSEYRVWPDQRGGGRRVRTGDPGAESEDKGVDAAGLDDALNAARRGEERGFTDLWIFLNPLILRYLRVVVGQAAEDVASETWLQAARDVRGFRGDGAGFRVWLFRVARNRGLDELRRSGRRLEDPVGLPGDSPQAPRAGSAADDTAAEAVERLSTERALELIARLPKNQAEAVMLRVIIGLDAKQSANVLGKRAGAVRIAAMRGLRNLSVFLADGTPQPARQDARESRQVTRELGVELESAGPRGRRIDEVTS
ncbi:RNA polymerase sigma factor [Actinocrinis sp.]|uniref:RNA polymerase sigma factor n=1 Tax=Actinocrinis sp. TaxID=1920516 RepID=UPI002DDD4FF3|nr:RNA polymerase sigma factor [Actinocrinis sp.]